MASPQPSRGGFSAKTKTFHSLRPPIPLPPPTHPLSITSYTFSLLPSPLPLHPALLDPTTSTSLSYPHLLSQIHSLASSLNPLISKGQVAFILSPARLEIPPLYLALLSLGAVVSPANPASVPSEISHLIQISNATIAFATSTTAPKLPKHIPTLIIDSPNFMSVFTGPESNFLEPIEILQSDPAAILYSSGTTGRVKGVVLTHRNLIAQVATFVAMASPAAVQMVTVPLFHVYGFVFCLKAVAVGETMVLQTERFDARRMLRDVGRFGVTHITMAPLALLEMVKVFSEDRVGEGGPYDLGSLVAITVGGAPVGMGLIRRFVAMFPKIRLSQGYGLTESTAGVSRFLGQEASQRLGSAGRLTPGCEAKIVDPATGDALAPGMQGEIWFRGPTIMKGYIGDPEATSAILNSQGWLKTGDLGYIDNDGFLFVIDRLKELIKYKGYQVPPAELENLLQAHPDIIEAAVIPYPHEEAGEIPMAFMVKQPQSTLCEAEVMEFVAKQVAPYKRIRRVSFVNSIPRNAAGKILRKDLLKLATSEISSKL